MRHKYAGIYISCTLLAYFRGSWLSYCFAYSLEYFLDIFVILSSILNLFTNILANFLACNLDISQIMVHLFNYSILACLITHIITNFHILHICRISALFNYFLQIYWLHLCNIHIAHLTAIFFTFFTSLFANFCA
jgi:hypothetical protein